jgi:cytoskeletal protein CcmA (bactofilin family)
MAKNEGRLDTVVGPDTVVRGDFRVNGSMRLDGQCEGRLDIGQTLMTGPRSLLKGEVQCADAVIAGRVEGNVIAHETVELQSGAQVFGDVKCKGLVIQKDCVFQGNCSMAREPEPASSG